MFMQKVVSLLFLALTFVSCYYQGPYTSDAWSLTERQVDSISFYTTHHYSQNFNFVVKTDTLLLIAQHPTEYVNGLNVDSLHLVRNNHIVVADITTMPSDSIDSIWVQVARDESTIGWIREKQLLEGVAPDAPISQFIDFFSDTHLLIFLYLLVLVLAVFVFRKLLRLGAKMVHFNDIGTFYPTLLCLLVATSAMLYGSIQLFAPESWRHYYYHPTLNPFAVPFHLGLFLTSVWTMVIVAIATFDDVRRRLPFGEAFFYFLGLAGVCAVNYVLFSLTTLYYVGYLLYVVYLVFALTRYYRTCGTVFRCGRCGHELHTLGECPYCGAVNE